MPSRPRLLAPLIALACMATTAQAQTDPRATQVERGLLPAVLTPRTVPMQLAARMQQLQVPGLSIAVVDHGQLAWAHAWGSAQVGQAMTPDTLMQAASISKVLTSVAALQQVEQGRLGLDTDLNLALRNWQMPAGAQTADKPVTLRRLLSHSAGFSVSGFQGYEVGTPLPTLRQVLDGLPPANSAAVRVDIPPGSEWRYSGGGFTVLQQLLEDVSGQGFAPLMQQAVLTPAGMTRSSFTVPAEHAVGHQQNQPIAGGYRLHPELAAAGLWTTPSDLARFSMALPRLLTPAMLKDALTPQFDQSGLGFVLDPATGRFGHDGSNMGFESRWLADAKEGGRAVIVMANANGTRTLMNEVIRAVAAAQGWADWMPPTHAALVGKIKATPLFIRGSLNDWGMTLPLKRVAPLRYAATSGLLSAGRIEFKIAAEDWATVDLGGAGAGAVTTGQAATLGMGGGNLVFEVSAPGRYRFELDARDDAVARLRVTRLP